jgi:thioredoxin-dependent peroxiredoxin
MSTCSKKIPAAFGSVAEALFLGLLLGLLLGVVIGPLAVAAPASAKELAVGDPAPDFTLKASDGKTYHLADFKDKQAVVLAWFPMAFTTGCTIECKSLAEDGHLIEKYDVTYFMASVDPVEGKKGNEAFAKAHSARFPILSDPEKTTAKAYGVLALLGYSKRWTFYIGKDGRIAYIDKDVSSRLATSAQDMAKKVGELGVPERKAP